MPAPVAPSDFCDVKPQPNSDVCAAMKTLLFEYPDLLCQMFGYMFNAARMPSEQFVSDMGIVPAGLIAPFGGISAPVGWVMCNGAEYSRTEQQRLFSVIGTIYGEGNGINTFNVPNMIGRFVVGAGNVDHPLGSRKGSDEVQIEPENLPPHHHRVATANSRGFVYEEVKTGHFQVTGPNNWYYQVTDLTTRYGITDDEGGGVPLKNDPPNVALNHIIKL